jgi:hypothetical protein
MTRLTNKEVDRRTTVRGYTRITKTYKNGDTKMEFKCGNNHPTFMCTLNNLYYNNVNCPMCSENININEEICRAIMQNIFQNKKFDKVRLDCMEGLELDGYNDELKVAFEYNGIQHYTDHPLFHDGAYNTLENQQQRDKVKFDLCQKNNIKLVTIPYNYMQFNVKLKTIKDQLKVLGVIFDDTIQINEGEIIKYVGTLKRQNTELYEKCKEAAEKQGGRLLAEGYTGNEILMEYECEKKHNFKMSWSNVNSGHWCPRCAKRGKLTYEDAVIELRKESYDICDPAIDGHETIFKTVDTKMWAKCPKKHVIEVSISGARQGNCNACNTLLDRSAMTKKQWEIRREKLAQKNNV